MPYGYNGKQVLHTDSATNAQTHIADCSSSEAAHFLAVAANAYQEPYKPGDDTSKATMGELVAAILSWADERNLIKGSNPQAQTVKLFEEGGELAGGVARKNMRVVDDSIGDMVVVLVILAAQTGLDFRQCVANAYEEIKDRKGRMVDGVFVKDAE